MSILDNARYAEIGKKAEARGLANEAIKRVAPMIEKETVRKYAPVIQEQAARDTLSALLAGRNNGYSSYGSGYGLSQLQIR